MKRVNPEPSKYDADLDADLAEVPWRGTKREQDKPPQRLTSHGDWKRKS